MRLLWTERAWTQYLFWQDADAATLARINDLLRDAMQHPFAGLGKPEPSPCAGTIIDAQRLAIPFQCTLQVRERAWGRKMSSC